MKRCYRQSIYRLGGYGMTKHGVVGAPAVVDALYLCYENKFRYVPYTPVKYGFIDDDIIEDFPEVYEVNRPFDNSPTYINLGNDLTVKVIWK